MDERTPKERASVEEELNMTCEAAISYLQDIHLHLPDKYAEFVDHMKEFKKGKNEVTDLISKIISLLEDHPDLVSSFNCFLPKEYHIQLETVAANKRRRIQEGKRVVASKGIPVEEGGTSKKEEVQVEEGITEVEGGVHVEEGVTAINFINKIKLRSQRNEYHRNLYFKFLRILDSYQKKEKEITDVYASAATLFRSHPDLLLEFRYFLPVQGVPRVRNLPLRVRNPPSSSSSAVLGDSNSGKKRKRESDENVDFLRILKSKAVNSSYRIRKKPMEEHEILNNNWVLCVKKFEEEDDTEKHFDAEDVIYELDMVSDHLKHTKEKLVELIEDKNSKVDFNEHFTARSLRCIKELYGKYGLDAIDELRKRQGSTAPVLLLRIIEKLDEIKNFRSDKLSSMNYRGKDEC